MAFNVNNFLQNMTGDGARPNLFEIIFPSMGQLFSLRAKASALPSSSVGMVQVPYFGRPVKFSGTRVFDDWTISVLIDEPDYNGSGPRTILEQWLNGLNSHVGNVRDRTLVAPQQYMRDAQVIQYSKSGDPIATYEMRSCFPVNVGPVALDWGNNNTIAEFSVTFALQYWTRVGATDEVQTGL
jgi:hypothetical protein